MERTDTLQLAPSKIPLPDAAWLVPDVLDVATGIAAALLVVLFAVFRSSLPARNAETPVHPGSEGFEALKLACLERIRNADPSSPEFAETVWSALRDFLGETGLVPGIRTMTAEEFSQGSFRRNGLAEAATLARDLSYAPKGERADERAERLGKTAEAILRSLR